MSSDEIAALYRQDGSTVRRHLSRLRRKILATTHAALVAKLRLTEQDVESLIALVRSELDINLSGALAV
jgi:hypothetical protein